MVFHIPGSQPHTPLPHAPAQDQQQLDEESLVSALHAAFRTQPPPPSVGEQDMVLAPKDKHPSLEIVVANDRLVLKGTGVDVEPDLLTGNVILNLTEPTSLKQINLVFRGKARLPSNPNDPHVLGNSPSNYVICTHEWSFLEGEKRHNHTLKAGRHIFPFELRIGGSLPSSLSSHVNGGAVIYYRLRATAVRPGFATNLTASLPITIQRTFAAESLEYQQTLEIENTWPEKVMYALMIPHKAWAAGDELSALVKFSPLAKGVKVLSITTNICETTKTVTRGGHLEKTRNVVTAKHEIHRGRAVTIDESRQRRLRHVLNASLGSGVGRHQAMLSAPFPPPSSLHASGSSTPGWPPQATSVLASGTSTPILEEPSQGTEDGSDVGPPSSRNSSEEEGESMDSEIVTPIAIQLPATLTPSHPLDPIIVSYRIRWSILLSNLDGHTSELRCSLPIHILDNSFLDEARRATLATRRLLFGGPEEPEEEEQQLPSYPSHVRDRVVDGSITLAAGVTPEAQLLSQYVPEPYHSGTSTPAEHNLIMGPATSLSMSSVSTDGGQGFFSGSVSSTPESVHPFAFTPAVGRPHHDSSAGNSSLSISPPEDGASRPTSRHGRSESSSLWHAISHRASRATSRANSRANSRAPSPERGAPGLSAVSTRSSDERRADDSHSTHAGRHQHGLLSSMMKPLMNIGHGLSHSHSHSQGSNVHRVHSATLPLVFHHTPGQSSLGVEPLDNEHSQQLGAHRHFFDVPAYASHPTLPQLSNSLSTSPAPPFPSHDAHTLRDLPTYEDSEAQVQQFSSFRQRSREVADVLPLLTQNHDHGTQTSSNPNRSRSEGDLVSHFARGRAGTITQRIS